MELTRLSQNPFPAHFISESIRSKVTFETVFIKRYDHHLEKENKKTIGSLSPSECPLFFKTSPLTSCVDFSFRSLAAGQRQRRHGRQHPTSCSTADARSGRPRRPGPDPLPPRRPLPPGKRLPSFFWFLPSFASSRFTASFTILARNWIGRWAKLEQWSRCIESALSSF